MENICIEGEKLFELEKNLRSADYERRISAIKGFPQLIVEFKDGTLRSSAFLRLIDTFTLSTNEIKSLIAFSLASLHSSFSSDSNKSDESVTSDSSLEALSARLGSWKLEKSHSEEIVSRLGRIWRLLEPYSRSLILKVEAYLYKILDLSPCSEAVLIHRVNQTLMHGGPTEREAACKHSLKIITDNWVLVQTSLIILKSDVLLFKWRQQTPHLYQSLVRYAATLNVETSAVTLQLQVQ